MTMLAVIIRRPPPCERCHGTGTVGAMSYNGPKLCPKCGGRSGHVEYSFRYGASFASKAVWAVWPTPEQEALIDEMTRARPRS